jgi:hypothetical protein
VKVLPEKRLKLKKSHLYYFFCKKQHRPKPSVVCWMLDELLPSIHYQSCIFVSTLAFCKNSFLTIRLSEEVKSADFFFNSFFKVWVQFTDKNITDDDHFIKSHFTEIFGRRYSPSVKFSVGEIFCR